MSDNVINRLTILMTSGESARLPSERGPGLIPRLGVICGLSLLLVLDLAPKGFFSPGTPIFPSSSKTS